MESINHKPTSQTCQAWIKATFCHHVFCERNTEVNPALLRPGLTMRCSHSLTSSDTSSDLLREKSSSQAEEQIGDEVWFVRPARGKILKE